MRTQSLHDRVWSEAQHTYQQGLKLSEKGLLAYEDARQNVV